VAIANLTIWLPNACGLVFGTVQVMVFVCLSRAQSAEAGSCAGSALDPKLQQFATSGDIFSFIGGKVEVRGLRTVRTWAGSPLCTLAGMQDDAEAPLPRANSAPQPMSPKDMSSATPVVTLK
jgi:hypothetical protein